MHVRLPSGLILISPPFLCALLLLAFPIAAVVAVSFWTQNYLDLDTTFTLANYREAWTEPVYRTLMLRSLAVSGTVTAFTVLLAFPIAYFVSFHVSPKRKALWIFLITIPFWTSYLLRIFMWKVILGYNGVINGTLIRLGLIEEPLGAILYNVNAVVVTLSHAWAPFAILPIFVALEKIDRSLLEAAEDLGEAALRRLLRITLPLALPGVLGAAIIALHSDCWRLRDSPPCGRSRRAANRQYDRTSVQEGQQSSSWSGTRDLLDGRRCSNFADSCPHQ